MSSYLSLDLNEKPKDHKLVGCNWIFKLNPVISRMEEKRFKARLVAKGFEGIDNNEIFSPLVKHG